VDQKDRERFLEEIWPAAEQAARARGLSDDEIAEKRKQALDMLDHAPRRGDPDWPGLEGVIHRDPGPVDRLPRSVFGDSPIIRLAFHRNLLRVLLVGVFAVLGYLGMPTKHGGRLWHPGIHGLVYGTAFGLGVLVFAEITYLRTRRRKSGV
jgi:hypothetical protein